MGAMGAIPRPLSGRQMKVQALHPPLATRPAGIHGRGGVACPFVLYGEEAFIIDVLVHCSPIASHQKLAKTIDDEQGRRRGRAMVITNGIEHALRYFHVIRN